MRSIKVLFGKFKGQAVADLPDDYLEWLAGLPSLREPMLSAVRDEVRRREALDRQSNSADPHAAEELISAGLRSLAKKVHPDAGGSNRAMQRVNAAAEWLRSRVRELSA